MKFEKSILCKCKDCGKEVICPTGVKDTLEDVDKFKLPECPFCEGKLEAKKSLPKEIDEKGKIVSDNNWEDVK